MSERIKKLTELTLNGEMYPGGKEITFDKYDIFLSESKKKVKRMHDYIMAQENVLTKYQTMVRPVSLDSGSIVGDYMHYHTMEHAGELLQNFYCKPIENLSTFEWQHATADYSRILQLGINGLIEKIHQSKEVYQGDGEKIEFLECLEIAADTLLQWAKKCSNQAMELAERTQELSYLKNLQQLADTLKRIPEYPAQSFYEAVLSIYILFTYDPDSLGTLDRTLYPYYKADLENGIITREDAKETLQELFLMLQANTPKNSGNFYRGGESHFCVGGYDENHEDCLNDFSMLIIEAVTELPTYIPQVSLRWTSKLPFETFEKVLAMAVKDENNRIAFINDEVKIETAMHISHFPYEVACRYSSVGCNEVAYPGGFFSGTTNTNILRSMENTIYRRSEDIIAADSFEAFFEIYKQELFCDIDQMFAYEDAFMEVRGRDDCYATSLLFLDCIETGKCFTKGACRYAVAGPGLIGVTNVIDSLSVIRQVVYEEKWITMQTLVDALKKNWEGYEELRSRIQKKGKFFGNDDEISNTTAQLWTNTLYEYTKETTNCLGYHIEFGNLQGYNPHHKWFGDATKATPDGRYAGDPLKFGLGQSCGYDREGLTALLHAIAICDEHHIISGVASVTNINLDEQIVKNPEHFPKTAKLLETYFMQGGSQFQLNFVSQEDLKRAKVMPEEYRNLRVRVSGFSDYFTNLEESIQDDIISRTVQK